MSENLGIIGAGYLGAAQAACLSELGYHVLALDTDPAKVEALNAGRLPFFEPGLPELLRRHTASGRLRFTTSVSDLADHADVHFICVGTPQRPDGMAADTRQVFSAVAALVPHLSRDTLIVGKSTVPVGTAAQLSALCAGIAPRGVTVEVAWNPEFLREGRALSDTLCPDRLVFGVSSVEAEKILRSIYDRPQFRSTPVVVTDLATSELVKVAANAFLATKVSFANALAELCEATGVDIRALTESLGYDERIGPHFLNAGLGFGGGCLPKDIRAMIATAEELGVTQASSFLRLVDDINTQRRHRMIRLAIDECHGTVTGRRIAALGASFKPNTDDVRDSPALDVAAQLQSWGADVVVYDPHANANAARVHPELSYVDRVHEAFEGAHLVLHLTEWPEFGGLKPRRLLSRVAEARIVDGRNTLDARRWERAGWSFRALGRAHLPVV